MKLPGPDHPITITANPKRVIIERDGVRLADSRRALTLQEASYPAVQYIPREDIRMDLLQRSARSTHCPYKGDASYFGILCADGLVADSVWSYEMPYPAMSAIAGYCAFYPHKVTINQLDAGTT